MRLLYRALVQYTNASVLLTNAVGYFRRVDPQRKFVGQVRADQVARQAACVSCAGDDRVHLVLVNPYAPVRGSTVRRLREPEVFVLAVHDGQQRKLQHLNFGFQKELVTLTAYQLGSVSCAQH